MLCINERTDAAHFLGLSDYVESEGCFAARFANLEVVLTAGWPVLRQIEALVSLERRLIQG